MILESGASREAYVLIRLTSSSGAKVNEYPPSGVDLDLPSLTVLLELIVYLVHQNLARVNGIVVRLLV